MLADAFAAERLRLLKARGTLFWSLLPVPIGYFLIEAGSHLMFHNAAKKVGQLAALRGSGSIDLVVQGVGALKGAPYLFSIPFLMIAALAILATDYRWETWRLLTPRNTRTNLMLAKIGTFGAVTAVGLLLIALTGFLGGIFGGLLNGVPVVFSGQPEGLVQLLGVFAVGWVEMMVFGAAAACLAVLTRSQFATFFITLALVIVQGIVQLNVRPPDPANPALKYLALMPGYTADFLKAVILSPWMGDASRSVTWAVLFLALWMVGLTVLAVFLFKRQDLTRE